MPKVGKYDYPFFDLDSTVEKLRQYYEVVKTDETSREVVAETLQMSVTGGGYANLVSSMEKYGLVHTGGGKITITQLGKTILFGEPSEVDNARSDAVANIDLFRELHEQYGKEVQIEQVRAFLRQRANVDIAAAQKMASTVANLYKKVSGYIMDAKRMEAVTVKQSVSPIGIARSDRIPTAESTKEEPLKIQYGDVYIQIPPNDLKAIALAKDALEFMEQRLRDQSKTEKQKGSEKG